MYISCLYFLKRKLFVCKLAWKYKVIFFPNLHGNIKLEVLPKLKLYVESPKVMVNKCVVTNCSTGYETGQKKTSFHFYEDQD